MNDYYITGIGIQLLFTLACGSTFQTTADAWQTGEFYASASQDNWFDHVDNDFYITGAQLNLGSTALPFQHEDIATVLAKCQRYYEITTFDILSPVNALNDVIGGWCFYVVTKRTDVAPAFSAHSGTAVGVAQNVIHNIYGCQVYYFATGANVAAEGRDTVTTDARF